MEFLRSLWYRYLRKWTTKYKIDEIFVKEFGPFRDREEEAFQRDVRNLAATMNARGLLRSGIHNGAWHDLHEKLVRRTAEMAATTWMNAYKAARFSCPTRRDVQQLANYLARYRDGQQDAVKQWAPRVVGSDAADRERFANSRGHESTARSKRP